MRCMKKTRPAQIHMVLKMQDRKHIGALWLLIPTAKEEKHSMNSGTGSEYGGTGAVITALSQADCSPISCGSLISTLLSSLNLLRRRRHMTLFSSKCLRQCEDGNCSKLSGSISLGSWAVQPGWSVCILEVTFPCGASRRGPDD